MGKLGTLMLMMSLDNSFKMQICNDLVNHLLPTIYLKGFLLDPNIRSWSVENGTIPEVNSIQSDSKLKPVYLTDISVNNEHTKNMHNFIDKLKASTFFQAR